MRGTSIPFHTKKKKVSDLSFGKSNVGYVGFRSTRGKYLKEQTDSIAPRSAVPLGPFAAPTCLKESCSRSSVGQDRCKRLNFSPRGLHVFGEVHQVDVAADLF